jgi:hypothetical protein
MCKEIDVQGGMRMMISLDLFFVCFVQNLVCAKARSLEFRKFSFVFGILRLRAFPLYKTKFRLIILRTIWRNDMWYDSEKNI